MVRPPSGQGLVSPVVVRHRRAPLATALLFFASAAFLVGGVYSGCLFVNTIAGFIRVDGEQGAVALPLPIVGSARAPRSSTVGSSAGAPPTEVTTPLPPYRGQDRVTVLLLGIDQRDDEVGQPTRSDTLILVTIDPQTSRAGMLSMPRDLWVPIPGHGENKINTAHFFGEMEKPGNGPQLAKRTIEYNFGVRVHYFARVDFSGFEKLVDAVGGITIDVPRPIKDDEYPDANYGLVRVYIPSGVQHMNGVTALRYARSRHSENDFGRLRRQQQVLIAARDRALRLNLLPRVPQMLQIVSSSLYTDIPATQMLPLASLVRGIQSRDIVARTIDYSMVIDLNHDGTVLIPVRDKIRKVVDEVFAEATPTPQPTRPAPTPTRATAVDLSGAPGTPTVHVLNGTNRNAYAAATAAYLERRGFRAVGVAQAARSDHQKTAIYDQTGNTTSARRVADLLGVPATAIQSGRAPGVTGEADLTIVLGFDARFPVPAD
ncbi:MAG: LCP family protein [Chloroflexi bacterium]|nr:LCP family protein [Chloroflexota bacterium]